MSRIKRCFYTLINLFEILLNRTDIRLYKPFSDWFGTANGQCPFAVPNQPENGKCNQIWVWFLEDFSVHTPCPMPRMPAWDVMGESEARVCIYMVCIYIYIVYIPIYTILNLQYVLQLAVYASFYMNSIIAFNLVQ